MNWIRVARNTEKWRSPMGSVGAHPVTVFVRTYRLFLSWVRLIQSTPPCRVEVNTLGLKLQKEVKIDSCGTADVTFSSLFIFQSTDSGMMKHQVAEGGGGGKGINRRCSTERVNCLLPVTFSFRITTVFNSCFRSNALDFTTNTNLW